MKVLILTNTETFEDRAELLRENFSKDNDVTVFTTDFLHIKKEKRTSVKPGFTALPAKPYRKNISIGRMYSHYLFAKNAFKQAEKIAPDIIYCMVPANSNAYFAIKYKKSHPNVKVIIDLIDLWPESFPLKKFEWFPAFKWWKNMRDKSLRFADVIVTECDLYRKVLGDRLDENKTVTLRLAKKAENTEKNTSIVSDEINFCYLGSVNNIIDIPRIAEYIGAVSEHKPTHVHIIGKGEKMEEFISALKSVGAKVTNHGVVYDADEKQKIFDICHMGINVMKKTVCVGLTMKSLDYLDGGLPLMNSIVGDTENFVKKYKAGFNINNLTPEEFSAAVLSTDISEYKKMRESALKIFSENLSLDVFDKKYREIITKVTD